MGPAPPGAAPAGYPAGTSFQFGAGQRPEDRAKLVVIGQDGKPAANTNRGGANRRRPRGRLVRLVTD